MNIKPAAQSVYFNQVAQNQTKSTAEKTGLTQPVPIDFGDSFQKQSTVIAPKQSCLLHRGQFSALISRLYVELTDAQMSALRSGLNTRVPRNDGIAIVRACFDQMTDPQKAALYLALSQINADAFAYFDKSLQADKSSFAFLEIRRPWEPPEPTWAERTLAKGRRMRREAAAYVHNNIAKFGSQGTGE